MRRYIKSLIDSLPYVVYQIDSAGKIVYINESVSRYGYTPKDLIGKHFNEILSSSDPKQTIDRDKLSTSAKKQGGSFNSKLINERRTGRRITRHLKVQIKINTAQTSSLQDKVEADVIATGVYSSSSGGKNFIGTIGIIRETVPVNSIDRTYLSAEKHYRFIIDNSLEIVIIFAYDGTILYTNNSLKTNLGKDPMEVIGENIIDIVHPDDSSLFENIMKGKIPLEDPKRRVDFKLCDKSSRWLDFETNVLPVNDISGKGVACYMLHAVDITSRKTHEKAIERRERIYRTLLTLSPEAILLFDSAGKIIMANDYATEILEMDQHDLIGMNFKSFFRDEKNEKTEMLNREIKKNVTLRNIRLNITAKNKRTFPVELSIAPIIDRNDCIDCYLTVFRDISEKVKSDEENHRLQKELLQIVLSRLSEREIELLRYLYSGYTWPDDKKEIGKAMNVLPGTLDQFFFRIKKKINMTNLDEIIRIASLGFNWGKN